MDGWLTVLNSLKFVVRELTEKRVPTGLLKAISVDENREETE